MESVFKHGISCLEMCPDLRQSICIPNSILLNLNLISVGPLTFTLLLVPLSRLGSREAPLVQKGEGAVEQTHYWLAGLEPRLEGQPLNTKS